MVLSLISKTFGLQMPRSRSAGVYERDFTPLRWISKRLASPPQPNPPRAPHAPLLPRPHPLSPPQTQTAKPNARTYASLIDACARAGDRELALRVYRKAMREGCGNALQVPLM